MENSNRNNEKLKRILLHFYRIGLQLEYPEKKPPDLVTTTIYGDGEVVDEWTELQESDGGPSR